MALTGGSLGTASWRVGAVEPMPPSTIREILSAEACASAVPKAASARANTATFANRLTRSFSRQQRTTASRAGGTSARARASGGAGSLKMRA